MRVTITKKEVLEAIRLEPLKPGAWIQNVEGFFVDNESPAKKDCMVCAVGGVLRRKLGSRHVRSKKILRSQVIHGILGLVDRWGGYAWEGYSNQMDLAKRGALEAIARGRPLIALSVYFESLAKSGLEMPQIRKELTAFVRKEFPKSFTEDLVLGEPEVAYEQVQT